MFDEVAPGCKFFQVFIPNASTGVRAADCGMVEMVKVVEMSKVASSACESAGMIGTGVKLLDAS